MYTDRAAARTGPDLGRIYLDTLAAQLVCPPQDRHDGPHPGGTRPLPDGGASWGTYYASDPHVMTANIPLGFRHLKSAASLQRV